MTEAWSEAQAQQGMECLPSESSGFEQRQASWTVGLRAEDVGAMLTGQDSHELAIPGRRDRHATSYARKARVSSRSPAATQAAL